MEKEKFVKNLKIIMDGMTQTEFANRIHVTQPAVNRMLNSNIEYMPSGETLSIIAKEFHCSLDWLLDLPQHYNGDLKHKEYNYADFLNIITIANAKGWLKTETINKTDNEIAPNGEVVTFTQTYKTLIIEKPQLYEDLLCAFENCKTDLNLYEQFVSNKLDSHKETTTLEKEFDTSDITF